jgi:hypothetical protein
MGDSDGMQEEETEMVQAWGDGNASLQFRFTYIPIVPANGFRSKLVPSQSATRDIARGCAGATLPSLFRSISMSGRATDLTGK